MGRAGYSRHITTCPHGFSGPPTALHTEGGAFAGCKTNLKPRNIFLHSFKRIWQAESKNSKWLGVISTNYTKKSRVWLRIYSSVYNTKTRMPCRPGGTYWDSWDFSQPNFAEKVVLLIPLMGEKCAKMCFVRALSSTTSSCTDLEDARSWIGSENIWDARFGMFFW